MSTGAFVTSFGATFWGRGRAKLWVEPRGCRARESKAGDAVGLLRPESQPGPSSLWCRLLCLGRVWGEKYYSAHSEVCNPGCLKTRD